MAMIGAPDWEPRTGLPGFGIAIALPCCREIPSDQGLSVPLVRYAAVLYRCYKYCSVCPGKREE